MRNIIILLAFSALIISCNHNDTKQKELELKERELALKEKEFALKYKATASTNSIDTTKRISNLEPEQKLELPFIAGKST